MLKSQAACVPRASTRERLLEGWLQNFDIYDAPILRPLCKFLDVGILPYTPDVPD